MESKRAVGGHRVHLPPARHLRQISLKLGQLHLREQDPARELVVAATLLPPEHETAVPRAHLARQRVDDAHVVAKERDAQLLELRDLLLLGSIGAGDALIHQRAELVELFLRAALLGSHERAIGPKARVLARDGHDGLAVAVGEADVLGVVGADPAHQHERVAAATGAGQLAADGLAPHLDAVTLLLHQLLARPQLGHAERDGEACRLGRKASAYLRHHALSHLRRLLVQHRRSRGALKLDERKRREAAPESGEVDAVATASARHREGAVVLDARDFRRDVRPAGLAQLLSLPLVADEGDGWRAARLCRLCRLESPVHHVVVEGVEVVTGAGGCRSRGA
mmetsp:Transcript_40428/g.122285  ORF Transcript_40428/g.122285 Transcript_40428/m.122285 type:complete len:339 (-) Transcript_40428:543-1559(-)